MDEPRVSVVSLGTEVPSVVLATGVQAQHLVGERLLARFLGLDAGGSAVVTLGEVESIVRVTSGHITLTVGFKTWALTEDTPAVVGPGESIVLSADDTGARVAVISTPPDVSLVRELLHMEHENHGFDV